jgi:two-component system cell cycle response regulator DivK
MSKVILIIEDNKALLEIFIEILSQKGYKTLAAEDGREGVRLAREARPNLILMDIQMPVMNGFDALRMLQSESTTRDIPSIALTSFLLPGGRAGFLKLGFADHIEKPFNIKELEQIVDRCLNPIINNIPHINISGSEAC